MQVTTIETDGLGDRSYVVSHSGVAVVIDPQRDIDRILSHLETRDLRLGLVCETHVHNDYVTGGLALARLSGADYVLNASDDVSFDRRGVDEDEVIDLGELSVRVLAAAGHTPTHLAYLVRTEGRDGALFTGGSMLYGTVGRTDLLGPDMTEGLTRQQYHSVRRLAESLPARTRVYPTHGFGSFCSSAGGGSRTEGDIADERRENLACTTPDEDQFVVELVAGLSAYPSYYAHMGLLNRAGPQAAGLGLPPEVGHDELVARIDRGEWVLDLRPRRDFAEGHLAGTISADVEGTVATDLGWTMPWATPIAFVADSEDQVATAQRELARIGIDQASAMAIGGLASFAAGHEVRSYRTATFADLAGQPAATVVDVRRDDEWDEGHIEGALHVPMELLVDRATALPDDEELWVHCASGYRSSIAASLLARAGKQVVLVDDQFDHATDAHPAVSA